MCMCVCGGGGGGGGGGNEECEALILSSQLFGDHFLLYIF